MPKDRGELHERYRRLHAADSADAAAELERIVSSGREVVVVSACLLGVRCRYDGGDKRDDAAVARACGGAEILPLCPEVLAGFGVPRPAIVLTPSGRALDAAGHDRTDALTAGAARAASYAKEAGAVRALLKERSPSCGRSFVHGPDGLRPGQGLFAALLPPLPIVSEEE